MEASNKENDILMDLQPRVSIQEAFKRFQKEKFYQLKLNKYLKNIDLDRTSSQFKSQLRQKFIQTAFQYVGVPYAQKFHEEGEPLRSAPLFLDCCGLVRQCVFDLRQEFGYTLAKWNQSYQFDLLPNEDLKQADLQPGDLIFYSATYNNPKLKPFPHKMVHVEIYLGEGRSIGARWQKGTIQEFPSYKFQSSLYHSIEFHYRSIDQWLEGSFKSHCAQHKWLDERNDWISDKFSVFADPSIDDCSSIEIKSEESRGVMVGKGNNSKLVKNYFSEKQGYNLMNEKDEFSPHYFFKWVQSTGQIDFYSFKEGSQIVNHIANICVISAKLELLKTLREWEMGNETTSAAKPSSFIPKTYRLDLMSDEIEFLNDKSSGIWIYKPRNLNQGKGIRMIADIAAFKSQFILSKKFYLGQFSLNHMLQYKPELDPSLPEKQGKQSRYGQLKHDGLIQHYIRPLLLKNKKFDIRCYMLLNSDPCLVLFHAGYLRLTLEDYTEDSLEEEAKLMVHLTNNCFQNKHADYKMHKDDTIANWTLMEKEIGVEKCVQIKHEIKRILVSVFLAARRKLVRKRGQYELLGCDIIVARDGKPYLLEVNTNPAMFTETKVQKEMLPELMRNTLDIALRLFQEKSSLAVAQDCSDYGFQLLHCEESKFTYDIA